MVKEYNRGIRLYLIIRIIGGFSSMMQGLAFSQGRIYEMGFFRQYTP